MTKNRRQKIRSLRSIATILLCIFSSASISAAAQSVSATLSTPLSSIESVYSTMKEITLDEVNKIYGAPVPFNPNRTVEDIAASCKAWQLPTPDPQAQQWYRAATALHGNTFRTVQEHQQMLQLYEGAARKGHYLAMKNLTIVYGQGALVQDYLKFPREPEKVNYWVKNAVLSGQKGALEWVAFGVMNGTYGFKKDERLGLAYMQQAANEGIALAQYQLALYYGNVLKQLEQENALMECAAQQDLSAAQRKRGINHEIFERFDTALEMYQRAVMNGGEYGQKSAYSLSSIFFEGTSDHETYGIQGDNRIRATAYDELDKALSDNMFLHFPKLNDVLPLPPAKVIEWKGIYSAMSDDDAKYYQNPPPASVYLKQVEEAGLLVPLEYISQPVGQK